MLIEQIQFADPQKYFLTRVKAPQGRAPSAKMARVSCDHISTRHSAKEIGFGNPKQVRCSLEQNIRPAPFQKGVFM